MMHPTATEVADIQMQAALLVRKAEAMGVTLRISGRPRQPLAMGNQHHEIQVWPARHWESEPAPAPHPYPDRWAGATPLQPRTKSG